MEVKRNVGLDLLRIVSMLMIVMLHYLGKGGALATEYGSKINYISWALEAFCIVAVNCYVFITGYFLIYSNVKIKKVLKLWGQVLFYSIVIYFVLVLTNVIRFDIKDMIASFIPIITKRYWFITVYMLLYILTPFINIIIKNISIKQFRNLIGILLFVFCICPTFMSKAAMLDVTDGYGIIWFICLYCIGAYIRLYYDKENKHNIVNLLIYVGITLFVIISRFIIIYINNKYSVLVLDINNKMNFDFTDKIRFYQYNSITILMSSLFLFLFFKNLKINSKIINKSIFIIAPLTFGVYLIHEQINMRVILYRDILHTSKYLVSTKSFVLAAMISVILVFMLCIFIEYLRHKLARYMSKTKLYNKLEQFIVNKYIKIKL